MKMSTTLMMLCITTSCLASPVAVPKVDAYITDDTKTLTATQLNELKSIANSIDKETGTVTATVIVKTVGDEGIDEYAQRAAEELHPGHSGVDQGVVLVVAKGDKKWAIRTTRNTGITLTDANSKNILNKMKAKMAETHGDLNSALLVYYQEIRPLVQRPAEQVVPPVKKADDSEYWMWLLAGILSVFGIGGGYAYYAHNKRKREFEEFMRKAEEEAELRRIRARQQMKEREDRQAKEAKNNVTPAVAAAVVGASAIAYNKPSENFSITKRANNVTRTSPAPAKPAPKKDSKKSSESTYVPIPVPVSSDDSWSRSSSSSSWSSSSDSSSSSSSSSWSSDSSSSSSSYDGGGSSGSWD